MATHARQQYFADESSLSKEKREFSIAEEVQQKIDSIEEGAQVNKIETIKVNGDEVQPDEDKAIDLAIPGVVDSLDSTSSTDALSAKQGKVLYDYIQDVSHIGHFLALWDTSTGLPVTDPETSPYIYNTGDFYTISNVAASGGTNYKPDGTQYVIGQASTTVETDNVAVNDFYFYDGTTWRHMVNSGAGSIAIDGSLSTSSTNPVENRVITNALNGKADATDINTKTFYLSSTSDLTTAQAAYDWYVAGKNPIIVYNNKAYSIISHFSSFTTFAGLINTNNDTNSVTTIAYPEITFNHNDGAIVNSIAIGNGGNTTVLRVNKDYSTPYTPQYDGSPATKKYVDDQVSAATAGAVSDTAYGSSWDGVTGIAPSKNAVYDKINAMDTTIAGKQDTLTAGSNISISGNTISATDTIYNAGKGIEIGTYNDYSAMRGPAPDGYHVPSKDEWVALYNVGVSLGVLTSSSGDPIKTYLKMPFAGYRGRSSAGVNYQGTNALYWSSTRGSASNAYYFSANSTALNAQYTSYRANGLTLRCFKDSPVIPDSSWTTLYQGTGNAGIFRSSSLGLISLSSDGTTWITIQDKNLGATTVYNDGDTLSEANCGYYYQWGNNYGFPWTGSVTTSSTQVDASAYGPGNYYSSSTFITYNGAWDTTDNGNLWGGVTGVVTLNNAISNTGVTSVNGQTGDVTVASPDMSNYLAKDNTTAFTPTGDYNPATKKYVDDNKTEYNAGEGISIGDISINGRKGPSPDGFHVPSTTEWQGLNTIMTSLSLTTGDNWRINLHMPFAGYRYHSNASLLSQGSYGSYWSSSPCSASSNDARSFVLDSSDVDALYNDYRAYGFSVRCFKDSYVAPDSTWTVVQGTLGSAGIFWNQSQGLISITDGTTGYTIMDKNLGATTVYNDGDTLTQANMGNMYQWGNNYGFPSTGTISNTSSTQVDASAYGPTNPYSSDTFIIGNDDWSSVHNDDLWGDTTGTITQENAISNTGVLSVNGQTGDVTVETGGNYTAGNGIDITDEEIGLDGTYNKYSDMQGPAPTGYHVPSKDEWVALYNVGVSLGVWTSSSGDPIKTYLKMPFAGYRSYSSAGVISQGSNASYWSSTRISASDAYRFYANSTALNAQSTLSRAYGLTLRCFKDVPVTPDSSWTTLYQGTGSAGIFRNPSLGLISLSSDGTTWITIADKNLGATTVYNDGDTLSEANCGKYYQWGNNYGFPRTGSVTTSSTKVDASAYGPGNYYSSDTFITVSASPYAWDTADNGNLWGGVTGTGNLIIGDKLYKIVTSTTAPTSGSNNVITFVTD